MSNASNTPEHDKQKRLTYVAVGSLCAAPFIGPAGLLAFGAIMAGKASRFIFNGNARKDYLTESKQMEQERNRTLGIADNS